MRLLSAHHFTTHLLNEFEIYKTWLVPYSYAFRRELERSESGMEALLGKLRQVLEEKPNETGNFWYVSFNTTYSRSLYLLSLISRRRKKGKNAPTSFIVKHSLPAVT